MKNDVVKKTEYNAKIKDNEDTIPDTTNLTTITTLNAKINKIKNKIPHITNFKTKTTDLLKDIYILKTKLFVNSSHRAILCHTICKNVQYKTVYLIVMQKLIGLNVIRL